MSAGSIDYRSDNGIAVITINRPAKRNAMTAEMCAQLEAAFARLRDGADRVGILCAAGDVFCAGADLTAPPAQFWRAVPHVGIDIGKPVIVAVQGPVVGLAMTMVAYCELCVAADDARFIYPEAKVGVSKGLVAGLTVRVPHKIAMELMLTGGPITAQRAYDVGFVNRLAPRAGLLDAALELATTIAASAPLVITQLMRLAQQTLPVSPAETLYRTTALNDAVADSADAAEGVLAFREKRAPCFTGR